MITALIVDDEIPAQESLTKLLQRFCKNVEIVGVASNVNEAIELCLEKRPQLLFLDIQMPSGSGFDILEKTTFIEKQVIFTTAYSNHAIEAIKANAIDYLLKPIEIQELVKAVEKAIKNNQKINLPTEEKSLDKIAIPTLDGTYFYNKSEIIRAEADSNYTEIHLTNGKKVVSSKTLKEIELVLLTSSFIRVHKSHLINLNFIKKYIKGDGGMLVLNDDSMIPVSRSHKDELTKLF
ncbi:MAG: LytR/AlgR family response regulator transcription factor [Fluviicola sp.]|jgi:two-component system LytT family response regulator